MNTEELAKLSDEEKRIRIAELCGWKYKDTEMSQALRMFYPEQMISPTTGHVKIAPDYLNDLNAMHEAEKVLSDKDHWDYVLDLIEVTGGGIGNDGELDAEEYFALARASAAQRADAFLLTLA